jgi:hypothetical protein
LTHLRKVKYFTKLNIRQTFHRIKIADAESKNLIIFKTRFDVYKYRVLSFELCNESIIYQHYMNDVFFDYLNDFVSIYINDILIYNNFKKKYVKHVKKVLQRLRDADLQIDIDKCEFFVHETKYLDLIVDRDEIRMNSEKIETILQWVTSQNLKQVQRFLRFCNFYKRFIRNFAKIVKSLIKLTRKNVSFLWNEFYKQTFELLKKTIIKALILIYFDSKKQIYLKSDSSNFVFENSVINEREWWTSFRDLLLEEFSIDRMQLRNLWQRIIDNCAMLRIMKTRIIVYSIRNFS